MVAQAQFSVNYSGNGDIITGYTGPGGAVNIPSTIDGRPVTEIGDGAFGALTNVTSVTISNGILSIDATAFQSCSLTDISIPDSVTNIGVQAFWDCTNLTTVLLPNSLSILGDSAFASSGLTNITVPGSVTDLGAFVFQNCQNLTSATIAEGVVNLPVGLFGWCALTSVIIPDTVTNIDQGAFECCGDLNEYCDSGQCCQHRGVGVRFLHKSCDRFVR